MFTTVWPSAAPVNRHAIGPGGATCGITTVTVHVTEVHGDDRLPNNLERELRTKLEAPLSDCYDGRLTHNHTTSLRLTLSKGRVSLAAEELDSPDVISVCIGLAMDPALEVTSVSTAAAVSFSVEVKAEVNWC